MQKLIFENLDIFIFFRLSSSLAAVIERNLSRRKTE
jgi:hypothetical protein